MATSSGHVDRMIHMHTPQTLTGFHIGKTSPANNIYTLSIQSSDRGARQSRPPVAIRGLEPRLELVSVNGRGFGACGGAIYKNEEV